MTLKTFLELGRVSNLPTVWTNVLCGALLAMGADSGERPWARLGAIALAMTLLYVGGMFLNDAFDAAWDRVHRPERPIPSGRAGARSVFTIGAGCLLLAVTIVASSTLGADPSGRSLATAIGTSLLIVVYDRWHKQIAWAPVVMGACRAGVYATAAFAFISDPPGLLWVCLSCSWAYVIGLTHVARFETESLVSRVWVRSLLYAPILGGVAATLLRPTATPWPWLALLTLMLWVTRAIRRVQSREPKAIPRAVVALIAGISLIDASFLALAGLPWLALLAACGFGATLLMQRAVSGT